MTDNLLALAEAYSERDTEKLFTYYSEEFLTERRKEWSKEYLESMESLSMVPYKIIPLVGEDGKYKQVIAWSDEERVYKNGSYEKLNLMELFLLDDKGKVNYFRQWRAIDSVNFGMPYGGKFFGREKNENSGRPFVFSNRGETSILEKLVEDYNKMDVEGCKTAFAEKVNVQYEDGRKVVFTPNMWEGYFKDYRSVNWKLYSIVPLKIYDTDPASGVVVTSREKRVMRNGKVWERELVEWFYFNLDGKIDNMTQFSRKIK